ncbi:putative 2-hydroxyacid dehydrogenase UNK4.10 [Grifola frondosa]|uniref:Putative 2-hydroxyacid dehydrogenase UNK4.10 n=1 Tax=Grifola frondosa TaxID=5627 RepID=A0A1C7LY91_GRIFR|nr:putative 2-hydroxyacid dehydrogenase UNK4.10 [Grifola frondosa]
MISSSTTSTLPSRPSTPYTLVLFVEFPEHDSCADLRYVLDGVYNGASLMPSDAGDLVWAHDECAELFSGLAEVVRMDSPDRADFIAGLQPGGKYEGIVGMYRHNISADQIGVFDEELIAALPASIKWIAHNGAGYDQIDVAACNAKGITVSNTPGAVDDATATTALYLLISALRNFSHAERDVRAGRWKAGHSAGAAHDLTGRTLAILGLGGIGLRLAELAHAFPMRIVYHSRGRTAGAPEWCEYFGAERLDEMLALADVLSVHVPLRADTEGFVDERMIRKLKRGAVIVNTARGKVIDEDAMIRALEDGHLGGVGLDVYPNEPEVNPRLFEFSNATLLPHMGTETCDSQKKMEIRALTNLRDYLTKGKGKDIVPEMKQ